MAASDLAVLADVKTWVAGSSSMSSADDAMLGRLITAISGVIYSYIGRPFVFPRLWSERYAGDGKSSFFLRHYPVVSIGSLVVDQNSISAGPSLGANVNWTSGYELSPWDGVPPGGLQSLDVRGAWLGCGWQPILVSYTAGYQVTGESATVPLSANYTVTAQVPFGPWQSDQGVTYANGTALTPVASAPTVGQYAVANGVYTFAAADAGQGMLISYGYIPAPLNNACIEWVVERYRYRTRVGQIAQTVQGQQTASYSLKDMPDFIRTSLDPYRNIVPI